MPVQFASAIGFRARFDGSGLTAASWSDTGIGFDGTGACSIAAPIPVEPGPVIPPQ